MSRSHFDCNWSAEDNPLGPDIIGTAIVNALRTCDCGLKVKLLLVPALNKHLPERVKSVYQDLNRCLVDKGVLPAMLTAPTSGTVSRFCLRNLSVM